MIDINTLDDTLLRMTAYFLHFIEIGLTGNKKSMEQGSRRSTFILSDWMWVEGKGTEETWKVVSMLLLLLLIS